MADDKGKYAGLIRQLIPINELAADLQDQVIKIATLLDVKKRGTVFKQGARDNYTYYLLDGEIELQSNKQVHNTLVGGTEQARYAMAQLQPRQFTGVAVSPSIVLRLARNSMDKLFILNQERNQDAGFNGGAYGGEVEVSELDESDDLDWMSRLLQSDIFSRMPTANIHQLFALLEPIEYKIGDVVVKQGDSGDDFYIIQDGRCQVTRKASGGGKDVKLAELHSGDSFGEEALLAETTRNATVTMLTEGVLMRLSKQNFIDLIKNPTLHAVTYAEGESKVETGQAKWLDVRYENEHKKSSIDGSINIPLNSLRKQMKQLDSKIYYIVYCDTGGRSSAAAFLLAGAGFDVSYLSGGLVNHPDAADPSEVTNVPKPAASKPVPASKPASAPKDGKQPPAKAGEGEDFDDPEIKASFLEAQIARTNMQLERTASKEEKDEALKEAKAEMQKKLEEERTELEAAKKAAEAEAARLRKKEEENLSRMEAQAKKKIEAEKKRLEQVYANNAEEMEKLEKMKSEAENKARQERERLEKHAQESKHNKGEAERLKKELETARQAMAEEAEKRREEQEALERKIRMKARQKLEAERKKMAEQYALNNQELEKARQERAAAEAARVAAKKEAEKLISEYKSQHESYKAEEEKRLEEDRNKLEEQQRQIQKSLQEIQAARADAEALKLEAAKELSALKEKQRQSAMAQDGGVSLKSEIKHAEARLNQAKVSIAKSQQQTIQIQEQKRMNAADLETKRMEGQAMRKNLEADLANFREELEEKEKEFASMTTQLEHMRRIKERAEEAKAKAQMANANLLSDVKRQLDKK
jgi:CRP-like cAMP-binding protein/rhodanese-related sulfurtransferase